MRFQVPQFIEVEDKIFGPLTFKQFIYLAGGAGLSYVFYKFFPLIIALFFIIPILGLVAALAFYKVNNRPFVKIMESAFRYVIGNKLYIWKKVDRTPHTMEQLIKPINPIYIPKLSESKLKDLTWSLDINDTIYSQETKKFQREQRTGV